MTVRGVGLRATGKRVELPPNPTMVRAPYFYPTRVKEQPTRLRFQQVREGDALTSPAVSIVWFGHVVMPELVTGNGASTARCIRPGGRRDIEP